MDLGTYEIKVVRMAHNGGRPAVLGWAAVPSPPGAGPDGPNRPETAAALEEALQAAGAAEGTDGLLVTAIGGGRVITRNILLPAMPERELETAVQWEAGRHIPVPLDQLVIRHVNLGELVTDGTARLHVLLVGAPRKLVRDYAALFREAGRELSAVDLQCLALWRLFFGFQPERIQPETVALLDIGANHTELVIVQDGAYCGSRSLPGGAGNLSGALPSLSGTGPATGREPGENREARRRGGASWREAGPEYAAGVEGAHLLPDIKRSLEWYQSRNRGRRVERLIVSGGGSRKDGVTGYLAGQLSLPVDAGRAPVSFPGAKEEFDPKFAVAAGLALWEMVR